MVAVVKLDKIMWRMKMKEMCKTLFGVKIVEIYFWIKERDWL